jgi:ankyrin repeat protein
MSATQSPPEASGTKSLPAEALSLEQLKNQARSLLKSHRSHDPEAAARIRARHHRFTALADQDLFAAKFALADAQFVVAREQGFESWPRLKAHVEAAATLSEETIERFKDAVYAGDAVRVNRIIRQNPALKAHLNDPWFHFGCPAVVQAATQQNRRLIGVLLKAGADVNARSSWALGSFGALDQADRRTAGYLIRHGAKIDIHSASKHGMLDRVREFVAQDPTLVHSRGGDGQTPLHFASTLEICAFLLDHGANIDARDVDHDSTPAQYSLGNPAKVRFLFERGAEPDIFMACALGDEEIARAALAKDPGCLDYRMSKPPYSGNHIYVYTGIGPSGRPLPAAVERGHEAFCRSLLPDASPAARMIYACWAGDDALIRHLLAEDPGLMANLDPIAKCAICDAAWVGRQDTVRRMLDAGFDIDFPDDGPPLGAAACRGWVDLVRLLIERGANLEVRNVFGGTPLGACLWGSVNWPKQSGGQAACAELLLAAGAKPPKHLGGSEEVNEVLRRYGVPEREG